MTGYGNHQQKPELVGTIRILLKAGNEPLVLELPNSLLDSSAGWNVLSYSQLRRTPNIQITAVGDEFHIQTQEKTVICDERQGLYWPRMWTEKVNSVTLAAYGITEPWLVPWHERLGHLGEAGLQKLTTMVNGMKPLPTSETCIDCVHSKFRENPHNRSMRRGEYPLEFIHMDTVGPIQPTGINDERYLTIISCDATAFTQAYPHVSRSDVPGILKYFLEAFERPERRR